VRSSSKAGDRFFLKPSTIREKSMTVIQISIPVYKKGNWDTLKKYGTVKVSSDVDNLSEGYEALKVEIQKLLDKVAAENRLADHAYQLDKEIEDKTRTLKSLVWDIEKATEHYDNLKLFLERLGIDPVASRLTFDKRFLLRDASLSQIEAINHSEF
jgi:predicted RNase H-like nuclease (RuvC/YqgF family)